jgi:hypothetical protein
LKDFARLCLLQLERTKTEVFSWTGIPPASTPEGFKNAGITKDGEFLPGFLCYGIPIGTPGYVRHQLSMKVQEVAKEVEQTVKVLEGEGHAIWTMARSSWITTSPCAILVTWRWRPGSWTVCCGSCFRKLQDFPFLEWMKDEDWSAVQTLL